MLAQVVRGRTVRLELTREQRRALRDAGGKLALEVLTHLLAAREASLGNDAAPSRFPLTEQAFVAVARRIGHEVGQKRARRLTHRLEKEGVVGDAGSYRQPYLDSARRSGFKVRLLRLMVPIAEAVVAFGKSYFPVGSGPSVKRLPRRRWWQHALFGDPYGLPPPGVSRRDLRRWVAEDEKFGGHGIGLLGHRPLAGRWVDRGAVPAHGAMG